MNIPEKRLFVSVFITDDDALNIWKKEVGVPGERIFRYGEKDNFWRMGQTGPCGPCSEIYYDHNPSGPKKALHEDEDRFVEIWNLVFMEFFEDERGEQSPLPKPSVDTGAGIERMAAVLQGFKDNYRCDIFEPLFARACEEAGIKKDWGSLSQNPDVLGAIKVVTDHARATGFLLAEGILPSNEGRGYVLRRIMRRAIHYARKLNTKESLYSQVCDQVIQSMGSHHPMLMEKSDFIMEAVKEEQKRFLQTLSRGESFLLGTIERLKKKPRESIRQNPTGSNKGIAEDSSTTDEAKATEMIPKPNKLDGKTAFTLYDTYGFPFDLTQVILREHGFETEEALFLKAMEEARQKSRKAHRFQGVSSDEKQLAQWTQKMKEQWGATHFVGYERLDCESELLAIRKEEGKFKNQKMESGWFVFKKSPFYPEGGGQVADQGRISIHGQKVGFVDDCKKINEILIHHIHLTQASPGLEIGKTYLLETDQKKRKDTANNHSATHLLNAALKEVLGDHVHQAGTFVNESKLRFDFSHAKALTSREIKEIEDRVNEQIALGFPVESKLMSHKEAKAKGAIGLFEEKYGDQVRVIPMGQKPDGESFSMELCGGTHVTNTSQIRLFKIVSEGAVSRRYTTDRSPYRRKGFPVSQ